MGKVDSNLCSFCDKEVETLDHLFWGCAYTSQFILDVELKFLNDQFVFSKEDIFFGFQNDKCHPYNFLILHLKYYIFNKKRQKALPDLEEFFYKFQFALQVERYIYYNPQNITQRKNNYSNLIKHFRIR